MHRHTHTHTQASIHTTLKNVPCLYLLLLQIYSQSFKYSCTCLQLSLFPWPTNPVRPAVPSVMCVFSVSKRVLWHYLLSVCLSACHRLSTNRCLCQRGGGPRQQVHICQTCVPLAQFSCQVLITCDISHLLHGWWIAWVITTVILAHRRRSCSLETCRWDPGH